MMMEIKLTQGLVALIDDEDWELVSRYKWHACTCGKSLVYAKTNIRLADGRKTTALMHRILLGLTDSRTDVDHIDGDGLNNRRVNLRACSRSENKFNRGAQANNTSGFKGVTWHNQRRKWVAQIGANGNHHYLGIYATQEEARAAYCRAALELHGDFANFG